MSAATKAPKERLTIRDSVDLYALINQWVEDHIDEIELNDGALPDDLAAMLDEVDAATAQRVDAFAFKIDEFTGNAASAKATKDRAARREKVWNNIIKGMKRYGMVQVLRNGGQPLKGITASIRVQNNSGPSTDVAFTDVELLKIIDDAANYSFDEPPVPPHPLLQYLTVKREAVIDTKALASAYMARRAQLEDEASLIGESDITTELASFDAFIGGEPRARTAEETAEVLDRARQSYIANHLAAEFPGVTCIRGQHLRID